MLSVKNLIIYVLRCFYVLTRPLLGPAQVCIFPLNCPTYALGLLEQKPLPIALYGILLRLLQCNPLTILWWYSVSRFRRFGS